MTKQVVSNWMSEVVQMDPEWHEKYRRITEYKFTNGRTFEATYSTRGPYGSDYD